MQDILSPMSSFKTLRHAVEECRGQKVVPFLYEMFLAHGTNKLRGVHLSDLTFTEEGNPDFVLSDTKEELINAPKHQVQLTFGQI